MKPKSLCLSVLIVAFLLASEMPRVHGIFLLPVELLGAAAKELHSFVRGVATGVTDVLLPERATMPPIQIVMQNLPVEKDGRKSREIQTYVDAYNLMEPDTSDENKETESSTNEIENGNNSQEPDTTNEDKETDNSESEKNGSQNGNNSLETDNSQKTDVTVEEKVTDNSAENNGSGSKEGEESIGKILNLDNFVKSLIKNLKKSSFLACQINQKMGTATGYLRTSIGYPKTLREH
ncbi:uncharacterized protein LOC105223528 [Bactrocera dorsalis]|uniref:Uncharacterized protein LOC105223528 n=1 Tax=Bactrocera dorsalis TaxID=27457 RepID=A0ABM3JNN1_BACDO|nr:uncharacterized protein LOC105223528 [Bactrocera dorsalis]